MKKAIFLSAGVPDPCRGAEFAANANTVVIIAAVSALVHVIIGRHLPIWGDYVIDFRANVVRNHWVAKEDREEGGFFDASIWEESKKKGAADLKRLIHDGLENTSTTCVLIGSQTYARPWVRYEIFRSIYRGNKTFGVHINQIKGKDQQVKMNGPNPFDYLALRYSADGTFVEPMEAENGKWVASSTMSSYTLKNTAGEARRGRTIQLSTLGYPTYCWSANKGYDSFATWVG